MKKIKLSCLSYIKKDSFILGIALNAAQEFIEVILIHSLIFKVCLIRISVSLGTETNILKNILSKCVIHVDVIAKQKKGD